MDFKKPRVALYYDVLPQTGWRNDGANLFLSYNLRKLLDGVNLLKEPKRANDDSGNFVHLSPINPTVQHGSFDLNILCDYGEDTVGIPLDWTIPKPNCYWSFDVHIDQKGYDYRLKRAREFDHVFLCHQEQIADFIRDGIPTEKIHYLPCAAEPDCYRPYPVMEKWDWCFIGFLHNEFRVDLIDRFCKEWPPPEKGYFGWRIPQFQGHCVLDDTAKKFSQSRIILNESVGRDMNMRTFEAMACRQVLLTEDVPPLHGLFKDGEHLVLFKTVDEAVEQARGLLADPERRTHIAKMGYAEIISKHTYMHRLKEILKTTIGWEAPEETLAGALR